MADVKVTDLPQKTTILNDTDIIKIVDIGANTSYKYEYGDLKKFLHLDLGTFTWVAQSPIIQLRRGTYAELLLAQAGANPLIEGELGYATDTNEVFAVDSLGNTHCLGGIILDIAVNIPAFGVPKRMFFATDTGKMFVDTGTAWEEIGAGATVIGPSEDGTYDDGLFIDFDVLTPIGTAVDRFNEVLLPLSPTPPRVSTLISDIVGVEGKLSFGATNPIATYTNHPVLDINQLFTTVYPNYGIIDSVTDITGFINGNVVGDISGIPYLDKSFSLANQGSLHLEVNGVVVHSYDLTITTGLDVNANGSGFDVSVRYSPKYADGSELLQLKYAIAEFIVDILDLRNGYNVIRVRHEYKAGLYIDSDYIYFIRDANLTITTYAESYGSLSLLGTKYISGVKYCISVFFNYDITINNAYRNTYSNELDAINFIILNGANASDLPLSNMTTEADSIIVPTQSIQNNVTRLNSDPITVQVEVDRTVQADTISTGISVIQLLLDNVSESSTKLIENFSGEGRRISSEIESNKDNTSYGTGNTGEQPYDWESLQSLVGLNVYHNTGLLIHNGRLTYPSNTPAPSQVVNGTFSAVLNALPGQPDYSLASGNRTYYRFFYIEDVSLSNFKLIFTGNNFTFVPKTSALSAINLYLELLAPATTKNSSGITIFKDCLTNFTSEENIGCYASYFGSTIPDEIGVTLGYKTVMTSGRVIVLKITASSLWTGYINSITVIPM